ncbi:MAG: IclR family transcriptional regulator, partial [Proteobacteria bacterium]|nr:IclR family transcriptional regulator [Pseudomonadota bacterium]
SGEAVFVAHVECHDMMRASSRPGSRVALHCSAVGKALLSAMSDREVTRILHKHGLTRVTPNTVVSPEKLHAALDEIRVKGYAYDNEEHAFGVSGVGAPIFDEGGRALPALSLPGPTSRIPDDRVPVLGGWVARAARVITAEFGGHVDDRRLAETEGLKQDPPAETST